MPEVCLKTNEPIAGKDVTYELATTPVRAKNSMNFIYRHKPTFTDS